MTPTPAPMPSLRAFGPAAQTYTPVSLEELQTIFQINSAAYTHLLASEAMTHPDRRLAGTLMMGLKMQEAENVNDTFSIPSRIEVMRNASNMSIIYGEYTKYDVVSLLPQRHVFLTMIETVIDPDLPPEEITGDEDEFYHLPHVGFHGVIRFSQGRERVEPLALCVSLGYDDEDMLKIGDLRNNEEFYRGLCYADTVMCQIMANTELTPADTARWIKGEDLPRVQQKLEWMKGRSYEDLKAQIQACNVPAKAVDTAPVI